MGNLTHKSQQAGRSVSVVNERYTTRACSSCGALTGPAGLDMLVVRQWICDACGEAHDRDINAAKNILAGSRYGPPLAGTSRLLIEVANMNIGTGTEALLSDETDNPRPLHLATGNNYGYFGNITD